MLLISKTGIASGLDAVIENLNGLGGNVEFKRAYYVKKSRDVILIVLKA